MIESIFIKLVMKDLNNKVIIFVSIPSKDNQFTETEFLQNQVIYIFRV